MKFKLNLCLITSFCLWLYIFYINLHDKFNHQFKHLNAITFNNEVLSLESQVFAKNNKTTDSVNTQLFYADYVSLVKDYRISKTDYCLKYPNVKTIIFVWSRVNGFNQRNAIRQTWANQTYTKDSSIRLLFVIGSSDNQTDMDWVLEEDRLYEDILQFRFFDSYHNCTLKSIGVLRWTNLFCSSLKFLMKIDDDMIVNTYNLNQFVEQNRNTTKTIYGIAVTNARPVRDLNDKYFISAEVYPDPLFPDYVIGAHIMTSDCVRVLYVKCLKTLPAFWLEDVYITGILANSTGIERVGDKRFVKLDWISEPLSTQMFDHNILIGHNLRAKTIIDLFN